MEALVRDPKDTYQLQAEKEAESEVVVVAGGNWKGLAVE